MSRPLPSTAQSTSRLRAASPEEAAWIAAWQRQQDRDALQKLILRHMAPIRGLARRSGGQERDDLITEGVIALIDAAGRFPLDSPAPFAAFAMPAVRGAILRARAGIGSIVTIPERQLRDALSGRMEEGRALAIRAALHAEEFDETSLGQSNLDAEEEALLRERRRHIRLAVAEALRPLGRQERRLVVQHLLHEDIELHALAQRLNMSLSRARSLEGRALHKMRNILMTKGFVLSDLT